MTKQAELWRGPFGDQYQTRNILTEDEITKRLSFFENIYRVIYSQGGAIPMSVLEVGAGQGPNMSALERLGPKIQKSLKLYATEINEKAALQLQENCKQVEILQEVPNKPTVDLVFTYGVLIHTHPAHLRELQTKIYGASKRWIMCAEYFAPETRPIPYRGEKNALWLDDYGAKWIDNFPLRLIGYGFCWKRTTQLDNITFWLFERTDKMQ